MTVLVEKAPAKLLLSGEYCVLEGYQALVTPLDYFASCSYTPDSQLNITVSGPPQNLGTQFIEKIFAESKHSGLTIPTGNYHIDSSDFYVNSHKLGIGSSAAVCTATLKLLCALNQRSLTPNKLFQLALNAHRQSGNRLGSGVDIAASSYAKTLFFQRDIHSHQASITPLDINLHKLPLLVVFTGQSQSTHDFLSQLFLFKQTSIKEYQRIIDQLGYESERLNKALIDAHVSQCIAGFNQISNILVSLSELLSIPIISEAHQLITKIAHSYGGAAKTSGAGGGDISLCVVPHKHYQEIYNELQNNGFLILKSPV